MKPFYIFDLDGTLADISHRRHMIEDKSDSQRWRKFYAACIDDKPNFDVIRTMEALMDAGFDIRVWSGRSDEVFQETYDWLMDNTGLDGPRIRAGLKMRKAGDYTPDDTLKKSWLDELGVHEREQLVACFDDRDRIVKMYRENGVTCYQVADGDF